MKRIKKEPVKKEVVKKEVEIFEYIRRRKAGKTLKVGVVLGTLVNGVIRVGWSKCNLKAGDKFAPAPGIAIAKQRSNLSHLTITPVPDCIKRQIRAFGGRCVRYFKDAKKLELP